MPLFGLPVRSAAKSGQMAPLNSRLRLADTLYTCRTRVHGCVPEYAEPHACWAWRARQRSSRVSPELCRHPVY